MVQDTERSYRGTNFVVITLIGLVILVGIYALLAQGEDIADDGAGGMAPVVESNGATL